MTDPLLFMRIREGKMNNTFGWVRDGGAQCHQGWDLEAPVGSYVLAVADGNIVWTRTDGDYGNQILLEFTAAAGVTRYAFYAHLQKSVAGAGQQVGEGELIAITGKTGNAAASDIPAHLHFEIRDMNSQFPGTGLAHRIDPSQFLGVPPLAGRSVPGQWAAGGYVSYVKH